VSFVAAGVLFTRLAGTAVIHEKRRSFAHDLQEGWQAFSQTRWVWFTTACIGLMNVVTAGPWLILGPLLTTDLYGPAVWGVLLSVRASGLLVMSIVTYRRSAPYRLRTSLVVGMVSNVALLGLALHAPVFLLLLCALIGGMAYAFGGIVWETSLQTHVPRESLSRIASYDELVSYAAIPLGQLAVGGVVAAVGLTSVAGWAAIVYALSSLAPLLLTDVRRLPATNRPR
jgi:hypothetical protein